MTAPSEAPATQTTDRPRIRHRRCPACERSLCSNERVPLIPAARTSAQCAVCRDDDLAMQHRRVCQGKP